MGKAHLFVSGRVQGVFYRAFVQSVALGLGLKGWVKNLRDGRVEALLAGQEDLIEQAVKMCRQGPPGSRVTEIDVTWDNSDYEPKGFEIQY